MPGDAPGAYRRNFATDVLLNRRTRAVAYGIHQGHVVTQVQRERSTQGPCRPRSTTRGRCAWGGPRAVDQQLLQEIRSVNAARSGGAMGQANFTQRLHRGSREAPISSLAGRTKRYGGAARFVGAGPALTRPARSKSEAQHAQKKASSASKPSKRVSLSRQLHRVHVADTTSHCRKPIFVRLSSLAGALLRMPITRARGSRSDET